MKWYKFALIFLLFSAFFSAGSNCQTSIIYGTVSDSTGKTLSFVNIYVPKLQKGTLTNENGFFKLTLPSGNHEIIASLIGYKSRNYSIQIAPDVKRELNFQLVMDVKTLNEVSVIHSNDRVQDVNRISVKELGALPNPSGSLESLIKTLPGVSASNELSSQYSVRGGSFDENLIYVNDIEIIRPFLIRSGQQEGLSFINPDLVGSIRFYAGGFEARYGDKMSSVLDVTYKNPEKWAGSLNAGLMGGSLALGGTSSHGKLSVLTGIRYKTTRLLLNSLDNKGEYNPNFTDWQMVVTYKFNTKFEVNFLGNFARNAYSFLPVTRSTTFGTYANVYNLKIYYDGREDDAYQSMLGALTFKYNPGSNLKMKLILNAYSTFEQERFDISGEYMINELDGYSSSSTYGDSILNIGVGGMFNHARNYLQADISSASYFLSMQLKHHILNGSLHYQHEHFRDQINEWEYKDSAGYSSPYSNHAIILNNYVSASNRLNDDKISGFIQDAFKWGGENANLSICGGLRFHYWSLNHEFLWSPRIRFSIQPRWKKDILFYIASGIYYQPPQFKEMRTAAGTLNYDIRSQRSIHGLIGSDILLNIWDRPFKFTVEAFYKYLDHLIPYKVDNVRVKYMGKNDARGYATGLDMKLYGEFVESVESWISLSLLSTKEDILDDAYTNSEGVIVKPGYYHRPTDQLFHINLFFQDYLPNNPSIKASVNLVYGSGFYISSPRSTRYDLTYPLGAYKRVDFSLSKTFGLKSIPQIKNLWIGAEIFNLFDIRNKASYMWIQTVSNQENIPNIFAVPNYLTSRRLNIRMSLNF